MELQITDSYIGSFIAELERRGLPRELIEAPSRHAMQMHQMGRPVGELTGDFHVALIKHGKLMPKVYQIMGERSEELKECLYDPDRLERLIARDPMFNEPPSLLANEIRGYVGSGKMPNYSRVGGITRKRIQTPLGVDHEFYIQGENEDVGAQIINFMVNKIPLLSRVDTLDGETIYSLDERVKGIYAPELTLKTRKTDSSSVITLPAPKKYLYTWLHKTAINNIKHAARETDFSVKRSAIIQEA